MSQPSSPPRKRDKEQVIDEVWTEARIREFLHVQPAEEVEADFHMLRKAYTAMRLEDFEDFVGYFLEEGRDLNAPDPQGRTVLSYLKEHRRATGYIEVLERNGARP